jgi:HSP20 family protein
VFHRLERRYGPFSRGFRFPEEVDPDRIKADFNDGLLRLEVPKVRQRLRLAPARGARRLVEGLLEPGPAAPARGPRP